MNSNELMIRMFVSGQAMSGGSINFGLKNATFLGSINTAPKYQFYSVRDEFPGIYPAVNDGATVPGELYELSYAQLRENLLPHDPEELELSVIELEDGSDSLSMRMRDDSLSLPGVKDITHRGGWRAYFADKEAGSSTNHKVQS